MAIEATLWAIAALLGTAVLAVATGGQRSRPVYAACLMLTIAILVVGSSTLLGSVSGNPSLLGRSGASPDASITLPLGLPWIGARFKIDALTAFFQIVINLGAAAARRRCRNVVACRRGIGSRRGDAARALGRW